MRVPNQLFAFYREIRNLPVLPERSFDLCIKILNFPVASKRPFVFLQRNTPFLQMAIFYSEIQTFEN